MRHNLPQKFCLLFLLNNHVLFGSLPVCRRFNFLKFGGSNLLVYSLYSYSERVDLVFKLYFFGL